MSKETREQVAPNHNATWITIPYRPKIARKILTNIQSKTKLAAWIMKDCPKADEKPKHVELLGALQQHFRVDIAGPCGNLKCYSFEDCMEKIEKDYKFVIRVEDIFSADYISPDTFFAMRYNVVPVLFGSVNYHNYLPPNSYISANTVRSPEELGQILIDLDSDVIEYAMYFWWKGYYYIQHYPNYCDLCLKARAFRISGRIKYYRDLNSWLTV